MWNHQITQPMFCSSYMYMYFILNTTPKGLNCFDLTFGHVHIPPTLFYLQLIDEKERTERKRNSGLSYLSLFFCVIMFSVNDRLIPRSGMSKEGLLGFLGHWCLLKYPCLFLGAKQVRVLRGNVASQTVLTPFTQSWM